MNRVFYKSCNNIIIPQCIPAKPNDYSTNLKKKLKINIMILSFILVSSVSDFLNLMRRVTHSERRGKVSLIWSNLWIEEEFLNKFL